MDRNFIDTLKPLFRTLMPPIHSAGWPFIFGFAFTTILLSLLWDILGLIGLILTIWCFYFFRDPVRVTPSREGLMTSPACGSISHIIPNVCLPKELNKAKNNDNSYTRISISSSIFDVHVTRIPINSLILQKSYKVGAFINASFDKASEENEAAHILLETTCKNKKIEIGLTQTAEWFARKIVCDVEDTKEYVTGQRFGLVCFGSRVDLYLPDTTPPHVSVGQKVIEGETIIADLASKEKARSFSSN